MKNQNGEVTLLIIVLGVILGAPLVGSIGTVVGEPYLRGAALDEICEERNNGVFDPLYPHVGCREDAFREAKGNTILADQRKKKVKDWKEKIDANTKKMGKYINMGFDE